jgi:hypothetical protein
MLDMVSFMAIVFFYYELQVVTYLNLFFIERSPILLYIMYKVCTWSYVGCGDDFLAEDMDQLIQYTWAVKLMIFSIVHQLDTRKFLSIPSRSDFIRVTVYRLAGRLVMNGEVYPWFINNDIFSEVEVVKHVQEAN